jgi:beta-glucosidase
VVIVGINSDSGEQYITVDGNEGDRDNLTAWHNGDALVEAMAKNFNNVVVVVHSVGPIDMEAWIDHPNITAVLWAGLPGQESGNSLVDVLYGDYNPSGRLPYTIAKARTDYGSDIDYVETDDPVQTNVDYSEKLNVDYRHFLAKNIKPRFAFGFGLSYSAFNYTNIKVVENGGEQARKTDLEIDAYFKGETGGNETRIGSFLRDS